MNKRNKALAYLFLLLSFILAVVYVFYLREMVELTYIGQAPEWFESIINKIYPRFIVEKERFDLDFFFKKSDQVIIRFSLVSLYISLFLLTITYSEKIKTSVNNFWNSKTPVSNTRFLRVLFFVSIIYIFKDIYWDLISLSNASAFYKPILIYKIFNVEFPSNTTILILYLILLISCLGAAFKFKPIILSIIVAIDFIIIQGFLFSFEKIDHGFATFTYAAMIFPFLLHENYNATRNKTYLQEAWSLNLIKLCICLAYFYSGLEKIMISGFQWIKPDSFRGYLQLHQEPLGLMIAENDFLCTLLPLLSLLFQLGFISILFYKKLGWFLLPVGILFHIGSYLLFGVGGISNPWILSYIFFIDWSRVGKKFPTLLKI